MTFFLFFFCTFQLNCVYLLFCEQIFCSVNGARSAYGRNRSPKLQNRKNHPFYKSGGNKKLPLRFYFNLRLKLKKRSCLCYLEDFFKKHNVT